MNRLLPPQIESNVASEAPGDFVKQDSMQKPKMIPVLAITQIIMRKTDLMPDKEAEAFDTVIILMLGFDIRYLGTVDLFLPLLYFVGF